MWWPDNSSHHTRRCFLRFAGVVTLAGLTAGCFQPLYGDHATVGSVRIKDKLAGVDVAPIDAPNGTRLARISVAVRDQLIYDMTGGGAAVAPTHKLVVKLSSKQLQVIVDINTARPEIQNYGIDANYTLTDLRTGKPVITGETFSRVSYDIPGQQQRFAGARGLRDAENRAAKVISDNIHARLASFFVAGT
jgi:LPS-assembly lipoprotein